MQLHTDTEWRGLIMRTGSSAPQIVAEQESSVADPQQSQVGEIPIGAGLPEQVQETRTAYGVSASKR